MIFHVSIFSPAMPPAISNRQTMCANPSEYFIAIAHVTSVAPAKNRKSQAVFTLHSSKRKCTGLPAPSKA